VSTKTAKYYVFCTGIVFLVLSQSQVRSFSTLDYEPAGLASPVTVNVKSFGATGDGINDDREAIQRAIDSVSMSGGTIFFPTGTYRIATSVLEDVSGLSVALRIGSFVSLLGEGAGKSIIKADPEMSSSLNRFLLNKEPGDSNISIGHLTIDSANNPLSSGSGAAISFVEANNIAIEDVELTNVKKEAISLLSVSNFTIRNNLVNNAWTGISLRDCSNGDVVDNTITSTGGDGILVMSISNQDYEPQEADGKCTDLQIQSNSISAVNDTAIDIDDSGEGDYHENIIVSENIIKNNLASSASVGIRASYSSNIIIIHNIITNPSTGILLDTPTTPPKPIFVSGNIIEGFTKTGIIAAYTGATIEGNSIYGTDGLVSSRDDNMIPPSPPIGPKVGIALRSGSLEVVNNHIEDVDYGIRWTGDSVNSVIEGNIILSANRYGISDDRENDFNIHSHVISNNIISDNRSPPTMVRGINLEGSSTLNMTIISNNVTGFVSDPAINLVK
jgi:parallel beta-helix repeat protein